MKKIKQFVQDIFKDVKLDAELKAQKEELIANLQDKYNDLIKSGMEENEAIDKVIDDFGSIDEFRAEFSISERKQKNKKLKAKRFVVAISIIAFATLLILGNQYKRSREFIAQDMEKITQQINIIDVKINKNYKPYQSDAMYIYNALDNLQDLHEIIYRDMNFLERSKYKDLDQQFALHWNVMRMYEKLATREELGYWNTLDDEVYNRYDTYIEELLYVVNKEEFRLKGMDLGGNWDRNNFKAFFAQLDIEKIAEAYYNLDMLAATYVNYGCLPENLTQLTEDELIERLEVVFGDAKYDISMLNSQRLIFNSFKVSGDAENEGSSAHFEIDTVTGKIYEIRNLHKHFENEEQLSPYDVEDVRLIAEKLFGSDANYDINYLKQSQTLDSNTPYHSYEFIPYYDNYPVYYFKVPNEIHFSTYSIKNFSIFDIYSLPVSSDIGEKEVNFEQAEALELALSNQKSYIDENFGYETSIEDFNYDKTAYVQSFATGHYDLMHVYIDPESDVRLFIHTETGIAE